MSALSAPFFDGLEQGEVRYQVCLDCGTVQTLPRYACRRCRGPRLEWRKSAGRGVHRAPSRELSPLVPYTLALVDLDEGARLLGHAAPGVGIGDRVEVTFFSFAGRTLVRFHPTT